MECDFGKLRKFTLEPTEVRCPNVASFAMKKAFSSLRKTKKKEKEKTSDDSETL